MREASAFSEECDNELDFPIERFRDALEVTSMNRAERVCSTGSRVQTGTIPAV